MVEMIILVRMASTRVEQAQVNDVHQNIDCASSTSDAGKSLGNGGYASRKVHIHKDKDSIEIDYK